MKLMYLLFTGGMIHDRFYTRDGVQAYAKLPSIDELRGQLCALLNHQLALLPNTIKAPINSLSGSLKQISEPEKAE